MTTGKDTALVLEGGGLRGVFTCGVLDCFMDKGIRFPFSVGVSAGACNGLSYMSGQRGRGRISNIDLMDKHHYVGLKYLFTQGCIMDFKLLFEDFPERIVRYDYEAYFSNPDRFVMVTTNCLTGKAEYFEEKKSAERVMDIVELENPHGIILSVGGQIPNNLAVRLDNFGVNILGTQANKIDNAENRHKFSSMLDDLDIDQPRWKELTSLSDIQQFVEEVGYPVLVRPSYVLSGAAMNVCSNDEELENFLQLAADISNKYPVVVSEFVENAKEIEFDAVANKGDIVTYAISEHVEFAGVHSGDATIQFPPQRLYVETARKVKKVAMKIAKALEISGPFNIQFLAKENQIRVIECNLRASRSIPFVSKVLKINFIELATKVMLGMDVEKPNKNAFDLDHVGIKASQFSFSRLQHADPVLGVDMASTGEVGCLGDNFDEALLTAMLSVGHTIPKKNVLFSTGPAKSKAELLESARLLHEKGFNLFATGGSQKFLVDNGVPATLVYWPNEEKSPNTIELLQQKKIDLVVNIPKNLSPGELRNGYKIRRTSIDFNVPLITNTRLARAFIQSFCNMNIDDISIKSWDEYH